MTDAVKVDSAMIDDWANNLRGAVALHLRQTLLPVEGRGAVIFPPTYANKDKNASRYTIDVLSDGTKTVALDSVGSQANRMEPLFLAEKPGRLENSLAKLVPQVAIGIGDDRSVSLLEAGHRLGDAIVGSSGLEDEAVRAFAAYRDHGNAAPIAKLAPTTLVFGAWDSRGTGAKLPRLVSATIRAWDVDELKRSAQYTPVIDYVKLGVFNDDARQKAESQTSSTLAQHGFVGVPSVGVEGGVVARGPIHRDVTVNLVALRQLDGDDGAALRRYILALALIAATEPQDGFLRQGCLLTLDPDSPAQWASVERTGRRLTLEFDSAALETYAVAAAHAFGVGKDSQTKFNVSRAKAKANSGKGKKKQEEEADSACDATD